MGFFSSLFGSGGDESLESKLLLEYTAFFQGMGMSHPEATNIARGMLVQAKQEISQRGWSAQPPNYGDWILQQETVDPKVHAALERLRKEGVRNEDIRWWWNLPPLERVMLEKADELNRNAAYLGYRSQGLEPGEATKRVFKIHPRYGDPNATDWGGPIQSELANEDRPLPIELKSRINAFIERHYGAPDMMRQKVGRASSFNALIREEVRQQSL